MVKARSSPETPVDAATVFPVNGVSGHVASGSILHGTRNKDRHTLHWSIYALDRSAHYILVKGRLSCLASF